MWVLDEHPWRLNPARAEGAAGEQAQWKSAELGGRGNLRAVAAAGHMLRAGAPRTSSGIYWECVCCPSLLGPCLDCRPGPGDGPGTLPTNLSRTNRQTLIFEDKGEGQGREVTDPT